VANGRFAPSPTGALHLGNLRTALVAWLFARSSGSRFIVRMEDLDPATASREKAGQQLDDLTALGLDWDGEVVMQSDRFTLYEEVLTRLTTAGLTYPCFCTRREIAEALSAPHGALADGRYPGTCRGLSVDEATTRTTSNKKFALRLRSNPATITFDDRIAGAQRGQPDDVVLRRNDHMHAYNLAVVVDDELQGVEEVVRADDLLPSTPSQIALAELLGYRRQQYAHIPLALGPSGNRLAKRDGAVTLEDLRTQDHNAASVLGILASSLHLARDGEAVGTNQLLARFDPDLLPRTPWTAPTNWPVVR
jgi:glutamyl-tRNA synthetase